jgi:asparagine synthase (glutamine-hydrolysing)
MCGIFALLNNDNHFAEDFIKEQFEKGKGRGPEHSVLQKVMIKSIFGFHRLAINGLNTESNQPLFEGDIALICNGEIYNYKELYRMMDIKPNTDSDCEVILHLYKKYGIEETLQLLDGVFSFILIDYRIENANSRVYVARDPYGIRPLYILKPSKHIDNNDERYMNVIGFASEMKVLSEYYKMIDESKKQQQLLSESYTSNYEKTQIYKIKDDYVLEHFEPGTYSLYEITTKVNAEWNTIIENRRYHSTGFSSCMDLYEYQINEVIQIIQYFLINAVHKRCDATERPIACLLSGGLDSSLITALVNEYHKSKKLPTVETYSIGLKDSEDLRYARVVADYLGTKHTEIVLTEEDFIKAIPEVIQSIESYDTTTVRASIGNWLLGKYISEHSEAKVIFNGDGSDELLGGYLYMHKAPDMIEFDRECRRLLKDIHAYDVLRSDKSISSHGLEPRTPFLDRNWVQIYLSIPMNLRFHSLLKNYEKYLLRNAFSSDYFVNTDLKPLLPDCVLWRTKEAFSDGVSKTSRSLYQIIQEYTDALIISEYPEYEKVENKEDFIVGLVEKDPALKNIKGHLVPKTSEQYYYRKIFEERYGGLGNVVPYFWMPKYVEAKDASARTLQVYDEINAEGVTDK